MLFIRYEILKIGVSTFEMSIQNPWLLGLMLIFDWYLWRCWYWCLNLPYFYCNLSTGVTSQSLSNETASWVSSWVLCSYWRTSIRRVGNFTMWTLFWWRNIYFISRQDVFWECVWVDQIAWLRSIRGNNTQDYPRLYHHHHHLQWFCFMSNWSQYIDFRILLCSIFDPCLSWPWPEIVE